MPNHRPSSSPIQNVESIDVVGVRNDAGLDLVVSCSGPLDGSSRTLTALREKVQGYIKAACSEQIWDAYPSAKEGPIRIYISCEHSVSAPALRLIDLLINEAASKGVVLRLVKSMA
jgi:hypothetical protein